MKKRNLALVCFVIGLFANSTNAVELNNLVQNEGIAGNYLIAYDKYSGITGDINRDLDSINASFFSSYNSLASILLDSNEYQELKAKNDAINNNKTLTEKEKTPL